MTQLATIQEQETDQLTSIMTVIERCALNPNVDVEKMQKLLDMQERILNRNAKQSFAAALAGMQADMPQITKNGEIKINGKVQSKYALFEDINEQVKPVLQKYGFAISFRVKQNEKSIKIIAILSHQEGHSEETELDLPIDTSGNKNSVQSVGSSLQYGKRYAMCALLNISTGGEDDDGSAVGKHDDFATPAQQKAIEALALRLPESSLNKFFAAYPSFKEIKRNEVNTIIARLNKTLSEVKNA